MHVNISPELLEKGRDILNSTEFKNKLKYIVKEEEEHNSLKLYIDDSISFDENIIKEFVLFCLKHLHISDYSNLKVVLSSDKEKFATYAFYDIKSKLAAVYCTGRAIIDCMRSLAHELVHFKQDINNEIENQQISDENDGAPIENEANSIAGVIMRQFGRLHPELY